MTSAIETFGLTKRYGSTTAVAGLNLRVETGQVFGFLGPNGAGKSTTIRMLLALQRPTDGRATLLGRDAAADSVEIRRRTGYLPGELDEVQRVTDRIGILKEGRLVAEDTVDGLRRAAPRTMEVRFRHPVDPADLQAVTGVTVEGCEGPRVTLHVTGEIAPVLNVITSHDPVDLICRPADLDELFLGFYRDRAEVSHAH